MNASCFSTMDMGFIFKSLACTFTTEFCDAKMNVSSFPFVCLCTRLKFSAQATFFTFLFVVVFLREVSLKIATDCLQLVFQRG